jgi:hypothetical protein
MKKKTPIKKKSPNTAALQSPPRRSVRFTPDPLTIAVLSLNAEKVFRPVLVGLVLNESFGGCSILINHDDSLKNDQIVNIKVGQLGLMKAKVIWVKNLEESIYKVGLKFID